MPNAHVRAATDAVRPEPQATAAIAAILPARRRLGRAVNRTRAAAEYEMKLRELPLQRLGRPEKIAKAIVFLAAKRASFITSTVLGIDGGSIRATA